MNFAHDRGPVLGCPGFLFVKIGGLSVSSKRLYFLMSSEQTCTRRQKLTQMGIETKNFTFTKRSRKGYLPTKDK